MALGLGLAFHTPLCISTSIKLVSSSQAVVPIHGRVLPHTLPKACMAVSQTSDPKIAQRSSFYKPPIWEYDYIQSLSSPYAGATYVKKAAKLKEEVRIMLDEVVGTLDGLEMIDDLQRLGVFYHFEDEIKRVLESVYNKSDNWNKEEDLHASALRFRLLRQHGYNVPQEVFNNHKDVSENFKTCLSKDVKGLLQLFEASYFLVEGESILEEARDFTTKNLKQVLQKDDIDPILTILVSHALELPLHWRVPRLEARWFIDVYERRPNMNPTLLQLAKLDFNIVQATHQEDLKHMSRWWKQIGLAEELSFARDRLMENFMWTVGVDFKPHGSYGRRYSTIANSLITVIDDVYDLYGTLDELELFTSAVERWDINELEHFPTYLKVCFLALFNSVNEIGYEILKQQGVYVIPYLQKAWTDLSKCFLVEAKRNYKGYTPTLEEYMNNAWITSSVPVILAYAYFRCMNPITKEGLECLGKYHDIIRQSAIIFKLANDLVTVADEMDKGDIQNSIPCYMHETGASEEIAHEHVKHLIREAWKKINRALVVDDSPLSLTFTSAVMNLTRMAQCMYQFGDGHSAQDDITKNRFLSLLINPIPLM